MSGPPTTINPMDPEWTSPMRRTCWLAPVTALCLVCTLRTPARAEPPAAPDPFADFDLARPPAPERERLWDATPRANGPDLEELFRPEWLPGEGARRKLGNTADGPLGSLTTQVMLTRPEVARDLPLPGEAWRADEAWKLALYGPLSVYGQLGAGLTPATAQEMKVNGRTGLAYRLPVPVLDVQLRGGPVVSCTDPQRGERAQAHSEVLVEVVARWALGQSIGLEYQGSATPALAPAEHDRINHDLRLALPLGRIGQLKLGARHHWESEGAARSWADGTELYLSFGIGQ
jgi:hypothetical protein